MKLLNKKSVRKSRKNIKRTGNMKIASRGRKASLPSWNDLYMQEGKVTDALSRHKLLPNTADQILTDDFIENVRGGDSYIAMVESVDECLDVINLMLYVLKGKPASELEKLRKMVEEYRYA